MAPQEIPNRIDDEQPNSDEWTANGRRERVSTYRPAAAGLARNTRN